jgi:hypothetical protein
MSGAGQVVVVEAASASVGVTEAPAVTVIVAPAAPPSVVVSPAIAILDAPPEQPVDVTVERLEATVTVQPVEAAPVVVAAAIGPQGAIGPAGATGPAGPPGVTGVAGPAGATGPAGDATYVHTQMVAAATWTIVHNLGKFPAVVVIDSAGTVVEGDVAYVDADTVILRFSAAFGGTAYLN